MTLRCQTTVSFASRKVLQRQDYKMTEITREKLLLFNGETDLTFLELKTWRSFLYCIAGANRAYCNQLGEASEVLKMFAEFCDKYNAGTGKHSETAATKMSIILDKTAQFHSQIFGDLNKYTDPTGIFAHLLGSNDHEFEDLKKKAKEYLEEHQTLEQNSGSAWKDYLKLVRKLTDLELTLSETLSLEELKLSEGVVELEQRMEAALSHYETCHTAEVQHRNQLARETQLLKKRFMKVEEENLCVMFAFINQTLTKLKKLTPQGLAVEKSIDFATERPKIRDMATSSWKAYLREHSFPDRKGNQDSFNMEDLDDDTDSYDEGSKILSFHRKCQIGTLKTPDTSPKDGLLDDILASLDAKLASEQNPAGEHESGGDTRQVAKSCSSEDIKLELLGLKGSEEDGKKRPGSTYATEESMSSPELKSHIESFSAVSAVGHRSNVSVHAWTNWKRHSPDQISIRTGMKLKQLKPANEKGMCYGYKRTRFGMKKYGFYPAELVSLSFADTIRESRSSA